ncbi:MAG: twin-arginine translocation signal domain-containing protein [Deltaproteobacteria bacterium]|nr:twin-arginine translocation signal domain-containing protein [Deltaproteobacteria bacterium]
MNDHVSRRDFIKKTAVVSTATIIGSGVILGEIEKAFAGTAKFKPIKVNKAYVKEVNGKKVTWIKGTPTTEEKLLIPKIRLPFIAQNGALVPLTMEVELPMTPQKYLKAFYIYDLNNPHAVQGSFDLTPANGKAYVSTRIKLEQESYVQILAEYSDGSVYGGRKFVKVTVGGC